MISQRAMTRFRRDDSGEIILQLAVVIMILLVMATTVAALMLYFFTVRSYLSALSAYAELGTEFQRVKINTALTGGTRWDEIALYEFDVSSLPSKLPFDFEGDVEMFRTTGWECDNEGECKRFNVILAEEDGRYPDDKRMVALGDIAVIAGCGTPETGAARASLWIKTGSPPVYKYVDVDTAAADAVTVDTDPGWDEHPDVCDAGLTVRSDVAQRWEFVRPAVYTFAFDSTLATETDVDVDNDGTLDPEPDHWPCMHVSEQYGPDALNDAAKLEGIAGNCELWDDLVRRASLRDVQTALVPDDVVDSLWAGEEIPICDDVTAELGEEDKSLGGSIGGIRELPDTAFGCAVAGSFTASREDTTSDRVSASQQGIFVGSMTTGLNDLVHQNLITEEATHENHIGEMRNNETNRPTVLTPHIKNYDCESDINPSPRHDLTNIEIRDHDLWGIKRITDHDHHTWLRVDPELRHRAKVIDGSTVDSLTTPGTPLAKLDITEDTIFYSGNTMEIPAMMIPDGVNVAFVSECSIVIRGSIIAENLLDEYPAGAPDGTMDTMTSGTAAFITDGDIWITPNGGSWTQPCPDPSVMFSDHKEFDRGTKGSGTSCVHNNYLRLERVWLAAPNGGVFAGHAFNYDDSSPDLYGGYDGGSIGTLVLYGAHISDSQGLIGINANTGTATNPDVERVAGWIRFYQQPQDGQGNILDAFRLATPAWWPLEVGWIEN